MSATLAWWEDWGAATGSPSRGTNREEGISNGDLKSSDDPTVSRGAAPIVRGDRSFDKFIFLRFTGEFASISNVKFAHTGGALPANTVLRGKPISAYRTPAATENAAIDTNISASIDISSGADVLLSTTGPEDASPEASLGAAGYSQYLALQLDTTVEAPVGASGVLELMVQYDES